MALSWLSHWMCPVLDEFLGKTNNNKDLIWSTRVKYMTGEGWNKDMNERKKQSTDRLSAQDRQSWKRTKAWWSLRAHQTLNDRTNLGRSEGYTPWFWVVSAYIYFISCVNDQDLALVSNATGASASLPQSCIISEHILICPFYKPKTFLFSCSGRDLIISLTASFWTVQCKGVGMTQKMFR